MTLPGVLAATELAAGIGIPRGSIPAIAADGLFGAAGTGIVARGSLTNRGASGSDAAADATLPPNWCWSTRLMVSGSEVPNRATMGTTTRHKNITSARSATVTEDCVFNGDSFRL
jgi:hypothetical protein